MTTFSDQRQTFLITVILQIHLEHRLGEKIVLTGFKWTGPISRFRITTDAAIPDLQGDDISSP
ncbi:MAG: hypothetical protein WBA17_03480 [Saprospiraceae bacterium]